MKLNFTWPVFPVGTWVYPIEAGTECRMLVVDFDQRNGMICVAHGKHEGWFHSKEFRRLHDGKESTR